MRKRSPLQEQVLDVMRSYEREGHAYDDEASPTLRALRQREDVTAQPLDGTKWRWRLTDQGRGGPKPERSPEAVMIARHLTTMQGDCLLFWPRGHFELGTRQALISRHLVKGAEVMPLGVEVRAILREKAAGND